MDNPFLITALVKFRQDALKAYYYAYVEPLEKECDKLAEENRLLKREVTRQQNRNKVLRKEHATPYEIQEFNRIRKLAVKLQEENKNLKEQISRKGVLKK